MAPPPPRLPACCGRALLTVPAHAFPAFVIGDLCRTCGWAVPEHPDVAGPAAAAAGLPAVAAAGARQGPLLLVAPDPARQFRDSCGVWKGRVVLSRDRGEWSEAFDAFERVVYDGTTWDVVHELFVVAAETATHAGPTREWRFRPDVTNAQRCTQLLRLDALVGAARAILRILKIQARTAYFMKGS